ncbi:hypothetical protein LZ31DRAFT_620272 [Colletotrichum somersetense]|nr:hypothetical protein LZ31DRAFT_620272 [Colletotrichum somersetense]
MSTSCARVEAYEASQSTWNLIGAHVIYQDCWRTRTTLSRYAETCTFDIGDLVREHAPYERIWVGDPGPEMDRLWDHVEAGSGIPSKTDTSNGNLAENCLDYVRQAVMGNADTTLVTHKWFESAQTLGPNFRTKHTCRNFEALMDWSLARSSNVRAQQDPGSEVAEDETMVMLGERLEKTKAALGASGHGHHSP